MERILKASSPQKIQLDMFSRSPRTLSLSGRYKTPYSRGKVYIGEMGRSMSTQLEEHERGIKLDYIQSNVAEHRKTTGQMILFANTEITQPMDTFSRKYRELLEIIKRPDVIDRIVV